MTSHKFQKNKVTTSTKPGFTMIEFSLATAFIAFLLVSIAIISSNIITIYQKGLTLKAVNSVGRGLTDELTTGINAAPSVDTKNLCENHISNQYQKSQSDCKDDHANKFIFQNRVAPYTKNKDTFDVQYGGVFCTGNYSYVWNTYYAMNDDEEKDKYKNAIRVKYLPRGAKEGDYETTSAERLLRIEDPTYRVCSAIVTKDYQGYLSDQNDHSVPSDFFNGPDRLVIDITHLANGRFNPISEPQTGFLNSFDLDLQLYEFTVFPISQDLVTQRTFMTGTFILATERGNINIHRAAGEEYCNIEAIADADTGDEDGVATAGSILDIGSEFNYCAINKFNFAARTAGM